jgi:hypothetical protein
MALTPQQRPKDGVIFSAKLTDTTCVQWTPVAPIANVVQLEAKHTDTKITNANSNSKTGTTKHTANTTPRKVNTNTITNATHSSDARHNTTGTTRTEVNGNADDIATSSTDINGHRKVSEVHSETTCVRVPTSASSTRNQQTPPSHSSTETTHEPVSNAKPQRPNVVGDGDLGDDDHSDPECKEYDGFRVSSVTVNMGTNTAMSVIASYTLTITFDPKLLPTTWQCDASRTVERSTTHACELNITINATRIPLRLPSVVDISQVQIKISRKSGYIAITTPVSRQTGSRLWPLSRNDQGSFVSGIGECITTLRRDRARQRQRQSQKKELRHCV